MKIARSLSALALIALSSASFAADEPAVVDDLALVVSGFADGVTVFFDIDELAIRHIAPGKFEGVAAVNGAVVTLDVVETAPCMFDLTYTTRGEMRRGRFDADHVDTITFSGGAEAGPEMKSYTVAFTGQGDIMTYIGSDGSTAPIKTTTITTPVPLVELEASAARLQDACP